MQQRDERDDEIDVPRTPMTDDELRELPVLDLDKFYKHMRTRRRAGKRHFHHSALCACWISHYQK